MMCWCNQIYKYPSCVLHEANISVGTLRTSIFHVDVITMNHERPVNFVHTTQLKMMNDVNRLLMCTSHWAIMGHTKEYMPFRSLSRKFLVGPKARLHQSSTN